MNQSLLFILINTIMAFSLLGITVIAFLNEPKKRTSLLIGFSGITITIYLLLSALQELLKISNRVIPFVLFRFSIFTILPFILLFFFLSTIQSKRNLDSNSKSISLSQNRISNIFSLIIILFFPIIELLDLLNIQLFGLNNYILNENIPTFIQNYSKTFVGLGFGLFNTINIIFQILIPIIIIIVSLIYLIIDLRANKKVNQTLHIILFASSSLTLFFINRYSFTLNFPVDILLLIINLIYSATFSLNLWDLLEQNSTLNLLDGYRNISIKYKFTALIAILVLAFTYMSVFVYSNNILNKEYQNFSTIGFEKLNHKEYELDGKLNVIFSDMEQISRNFPETEAEIQNSLQSLQEKHQDISLLAYVPLRGNTITATTLDETSIVLSNEEWFSVVEMSGQPYTGFVTDEINLLNSGFEIVFPLYLQNSRFPTGYFYAELLFRDMEAFQTDNYFNIFTELEVPVYSTYSYLTEETLPFTPSQTITPDSPSIPLNSVHNGVIYYNFFDEFILFNNTSAPLSTTISYITPSNVATNNSGELINLLGIMTLSIILLSILMQFIIKHEILKPISIFIKKYDDKFQSNQFEKIIISSNDELNTLSKTLNKDYEYQLNREAKLNQKLEDLTFRLNRRATQLSAFTSIISNATPSIEDINTMLTRYTQVISEQFNFYHVGIFLLDNNKEYAVLQSSNSPGGKRMLARGHRLEVGRVGCVGYAASTGRSRIAQDIGSDILYYANPDMPETMSEISIPMIENNSVIGVLDIQSKEKNAFLQDDIEILTSLASQIVFSIRNYETMASAEKTLTELSELYGEKIKDAWNKHIEKQALQYVYKQTGVADTAELVLDESLLADPKRIQKEIRLRNQSIGKIQLRKEESDWTEDELTLIEDIIEQSAQALETARLAQQTRSRSAQIELLQNVTAICASSLDQLSILDNVSDEILNELDLSHISILLHDEEKSLINVVVDKSSDGKPSSLLNQKANPLESTMLMEVSNTHQIRVLYHAKDYLLDSILNQILEKHESSSTLILVPLTTREISNGIMVLVVDSEDNLIIDEQESTLLEQLASQIASSLEISNLFESELESRQATTALLDISRLASSSLAIGEVLSEVAQKTAVETNAYRCSIFQVNADAEKFIPMLTRLATGASDLAYLRRIQEFFSTPIEDIPPLNNFSKGASSILLQISEAPENIRHQWMLPYEISHILIVPIVSQAQLVGAIVLDSLEVEQPFGNPQINLAEAISGILATTIENASLFEKAIDRAEREHLVSDITTKIRNSNNPKEILHTAINELRQVYKQDAEYNNISESSKSSTKEGES